MKVEYKSGSNCSGCKGAMMSIGVQRIQLGGGRFFFNDYSHAFSGALEVEICICSECGKTEFYSTKAKYYSKRATKTLYE